MFDINGSKTKLDQESLFSTDHIEYWKCNIPLTQAHPTPPNNYHQLYRKIESWNLKGFKGI